MTFRATIKDGYIQVPPDVRLPDGTRVDVQPVARKAAAAKRTPAKKPRAGTSGASLLKSLPGLGAWKKRRDIGDSVEFVRRMRRRSLKRRLDG